jgi:hypothetical protein
MECRWCGNDHPVSELCRAQRVSRRLFCFALGAAAVAAALPSAAEKRTLSEWGFTYAFDASRERDVTKTSLWRQKDEEWIWVADLEDIKMPPIQLDTLYGVERNGTIETLFRRSEISFPINFTRA